MKVFLSHVACKVKIMLNLPSYLSEIIYFGVMN